MSKAREFIERHRLEADRIRIDEQIGRYLEEMDRGLAGEDSCLLMIPTFLSPRRDLPRNEPILCVDAGGTNLRICTAYFDDEGKFCHSDIAKYIMPGVEKELDADEYFTLVADFVRPYLADSRNICISFAYRTKVTDKIDAEIIELTKEVNVRNPEGRLLGAEVVAALRHMGEDNVRAIVINDTVAGSLSGRSDFPGYGGYTGTVLGTGSNSCYSESYANIKKIPNLPAEGEMVINTEAGSYDKMPRTDIDIAFDATTKNPGIGIAEKMTSGAYLGPLCGFTLRVAGAEGVFTTKAIEHLHHLKSRAASEFLNYDEGAIEEFLLNEEDERAAREILLEIADRAARLVALQMAACVMKSVRSSDDMLMTMEGSTYEKFYGLKDGIHHHLFSYLESQGIKGRIETPEYVVLKGCLIAGLSGLL
ncbi:MAG: hypothetical protein HDQ87_04840 [Clostridia bacterium]|nr:hypothetical protein [Clostridia bacterium]